MNLSEVTHALQAKGRLVWPFVVQGSNLAISYVERVAGGHVSSRDILDSVSRLERNVMSQIERLQAAVASQTQAISSAQERIAEDVNTLRTELSTALSEKPELNEILDRIEQNTNTIVSIDPVVSEVIASDEVVTPTDPSAGGEVASGDDAGTTPAEGETTNG